MVIISRASNTNNSRAAVRFSENGVLSNAAKIAAKYDCGFSHNVTVRPVCEDKDLPLYNESFGTVSFNKGNHVAALAEFLN